MKLTSTIAFCLLLAYACKAQTKLAQPGVIPGIGDFYSIRNKDFSQLVGASTPGLSVNYTVDKATLNGSFTIGKAENKPKPSWKQLVASVGTTTSLFTLGQDIPQPDYSLGLSITKIVKNVYYYDGTFTMNYDTITKVSDPSVIQTKGPFRYTQALQKKLEAATPVLKKTDKLYTAKVINWVSVLPEIGGANFNFYNKNRPFSSQMTTEYYHLWALTASFNHYYFLNNEDVKWRGWPVTRFFYYKVAVRYGTNSITEILKKTTIQDISSSYQNDPMTVTRQTVKSTSAYNGDFLQYNALTPSFEILYSFAKTIALDFFGSYNIITSKYSGFTNNGNVAGGLYFNSKTSGSKFNIGIYYQRSLEVYPVKEIIGLKTKVPIDW